MMRIGCLEIYRLAKQQFREARILVQDYIILLIAGACLGVLSNMKDTNLGSQGYHFTIIALGTNTKCTRPVHAVVLSLSVSLIIHPPDHSPLSHVWYLQRA